ncbi:MAG: tyrosinase family protein [Actinomycetota bacterium]|nr:tyrosinase family protein [Actinomycetota bacterium]
MSVLASPMAWKGSDVQANVDRLAAGGVALRKSIYNLTPDELAAYREAVDKLMQRNDNRGYNFLAGIHGVPQQLCVHHQWHWLPWHRVYLYLFEQSLQDQVPGVTIPWWDWTSDDAHANGIPSAFTDPATPDGNPNPLLKASIQVLNPQPNWPTETHRSPQPPDSPLLPTRNDITGSLRIPFFDSDPTGFSENFAGYHDNVHVWVGGEMGIVPWSSYDPLFWSHHCMVDRVWYLWQIQPTNANFVWDPDLLTTPLIVPGTSFTVADILDITKLGYGYASTEVAIAQEA